MMYHPVHQKEGEEVEKRIRNKGGENETDKKGDW